MKARGSGAARWAIILSKKNDIILKKNVDALSNISIARLLRPVIS